MKPEDKTTNSANPQVSFLLPLLFVAAIVVGVVILILSGIGVF